MQSYRAARRGPLWYITEARRIQEIKDKAKRIEEMTYTPPEKTVTYFVKNNSKWNGLPNNNQTPDELLCAQRRFTPSMEIEQYCKISAEKFKVDFMLVLSDSRKTKIALARQVVFYLTMKNTNLSLPRIGAVFGGKDHTTVLYGINKIAQILETEAEHYKTIRAIIEASQSVRPSNGWWGS